MKVLQGVYDWRASGRFLMEAAAVVRGNTPRNVLSSIEFDGDGQNCLLILDDSIEISLPTTSGRHEIYHAIVPVRDLDPPPMGEPTGDPITFPAPPTSVSGELLYDLGNHAIALVDYGPRQFSYSRVHTDGVGLVAIDVQDIAGMTYQTIVSLTDSMPLVGTPYSIVDWIVGGKGLPDAGGGLLIRDLTT